RQEQRADGLCAEQVAAKPSQLTTPCPAGQVRHVQHVGHSSAVGRHQAGGPHDSDTCSTHTTGILHIAESRRRAQSIPSLSLPRFPGTWRIPAICSSAVSLTGVKREITLTATAIYNSSDRLSLGSRPRTAGKMAIGTARRCYGGACSKGHCRKPKSRILDEPGR